MSIVSVTDAQNIMHVGDLATVTLAFEADGVAVDPTAVYVDVIKGDATTKTYQYGIDSEVIKDAGTGNYHVDLSLTVAGAWKLGARATGSGQVTEWVTFFVHVYEPKP